MHNQNENKVLAMYDVRGIQNYIYKTSKLQDAIGASAIVENIIDRALKAAKDEYEFQTHSTLSCSFEWVTKDGIIIPYDEAGDKDITVLYTGGGNSFISYKSEDLCININKKMSRYVLENTYSLQLAIAYVDRSSNYRCDYDKVQNEMFKIKSNMKEARPLGALPIMRVEGLSGFPLNADVPESLRQDDYRSLESYKKKEAEKSDEERKKLDEIAKQFDSYTVNKGEDSVLAVVHIDGNNMGLRIKSILSNQDNYNKAVNAMRQLSYNINNSYKQVFDEVMNSFNHNGTKQSDNPEEYNILKVLVAGDDITYVCKAKCALPSVKLFADKISKNVMFGNKTEDNLNKYGFSVCAGISFIRSHFPFWIAYNVAESCCDSAKKKAKKKENMLKLSDNTYKVGNWVDFHVCKNIQAGDLETVRENEYKNLLIRPYNLMLFDNQKSDSLDTYESLINNIVYFNNDSNIPRSFAKDIRNAYSIGESATEQVNAFITSRGKKLPDAESTNDNKMYIEIKKDNESIEKIAKWYDALEIMDLYDSSWENTDNSSKSAKEK